jgi:uncharacterized protein YbjT (DUF2867 family)
MSKIHVTGASGHLGRKTLQTLRPQRLHGLPQPNSRTGVNSHDGRRRETRTD